MFEKYFLMGAASACMIGAAAAADLPSRIAPPVYVPPPVPVFTWTGFHVGGNAGYAWTKNNVVRTAANDAITAAQLTSGTVPGSFGLNAHGFTGGGQIGYNYQLPPSTFGGAGFGGLVVGIEADAAYTDLRRAQTFDGADGVPNQYSSRLDYLGTVRGRVGVAFDRLLVYGTGGFAYGQTSLSQTILPVNLPAGFPLSPIWSGSRRTTETGYAVGGGIEYAIPTASLLNPLGAGAVTLKVEYLYYDLGTMTVNLQPGPLYGPAGTSFTDRIRTSGNLVRGGINYKFDLAAPAPVVARY